MVSVLRFLKQSAVYSKGGSSYERLCEFIRDKRLISQRILENLMKFPEKKVPPAEVLSEEEKYDERES